MKRQLASLFTPTIGLAVVAVTVLWLGTTTPNVAAFNEGIEDGANAARGVDQASNLFGSTGVFNTVTNVLLFIVGAVSVIMIIIGGMRYILSGGNSANVTAAKNTILYAIVGIVVAILGYAIVNFVITSFTTDGSGGGGGSAGGF